MRNKNIQYFDDDTISIYDIWLSIKRRRWLICIITLLSFICFFVYSVLAPNVYKVSVILVQYLDKDILDLSNDGRSIYLNDGQSKYLINFLEIKSALWVLEDLPRKQQINVLGLEGSAQRVIKDMQITKIEKNEQLKVEVYTLDKDVGISIINALTDYINSLPFIKKRIEDRKSLLQKNKDELKKIIDDPTSYINLPDNMALSEILMSIYNLRSMYDKITYAIAELEKGKVVSQAKKPIIPERPYKPKRMMLKLLGLAVGAFLGILFALFLEWITSSRREHEALARNNTP